MRIHTSSSQQAHAFSPLQGKRYVVQDWWEFRGVFDHEVLHDNEIVAVGGWPICGRTVGFHNDGRLLRQFKILYNSFDRARQNSALETTKARRNYVLEVEFEARPESASPVDTVRKSHRGRNTKSRNARLHPA